LAAAESDWLRHKRIVLAALEFVGQFINTGTSSHQFGYIARINGLDQVFNNATAKNESTAMFSFFTEGTTVHVFVNGPLKIVERTGTTTVYHNPMQPAQPAAVSSVPGPVFSSSMDGHIRAFSAEDGNVLWDFDTVRDYSAVNGVPAHGGSLDGAGPVLHKFRLPALWRHAR
jgi:outer membrane protein assembly factor BamB